MENLPGPRDGSKNYPAEQWASVSHSATFSVFSATSAFYVKSSSSKKENLLCPFTVLKKKNLKWDSRCLGGKPSILIACALQLLPPALRCTLNSTRLLSSLPLSPPHSSYHIIHFFLSSLCLSLTLLSHVPHPLFIDSLD